MKMVNWHNSISGPSVRHKVSGSIEAENIVRKIYPNASHEGALRSHWWYIEEHKYVALFMCYKTRVGHGGWLYINETGKV